MAQLSKQHLKKRGGRWYLKLAIPRALRHLYPSATGKPRTHIEERIGTTDLAEANRLKHRHIARWYADFEAKRRGHAGTLPPEIEEAARYRESLNDPDLEGINREVTLESLGDRYVEIEQAAGPERAAQFHRLATARISLREAWEKWTRVCEHNAATKLKDEQAFRGLMDFLGRADAAPEDVTNKLAREYVEWLNLEAQSARGGPLSHATKQGRIAPLRIFWSSYLDHHELVPVGVNPWRGVKLTGKRKSTGDQADRKRPYTDAEILALINGPELSARDDVRYTKRTILEVYALTLYTGARIGELANLRLGDIEKIKGGYTIHIRAAKTDDSIRAFPVLHLIPVAVLKRRIGERKHPEAQLFEEFIPGGPNKSLAWYVSKAMGRYRDRVGLGVATDTHSTRRRLISELLNRGIEKTPVQFYVGHKPDGITAGVYARPTTKGLASVARAIRYPPVVEKGLKAKLGL